jgi:hypothetical protein
VGLLVSIDRLPDDTRVMQVTVAETVFSIAVWDGWVIAAAPSFRWMIGRREDQVAEWARRRGGGLREINQTTQISA